MFRENKQTQTNLLTDSYLLTSERAQKMIEQSWAGSFAQIIFPSINETRFDVLYHEDNGRPNTPINYVLGALILKETLGLKDEDLILRCHTDICFQHALHSTSWEEQPVSDRTFSRFRRACYLYEIETGIDLIQEEMEGLTDKLITYFNVNHTQKRMDSVMIASNTKRLSQLELLYTCVEKLIRTIDKEFSTFDISEFEHYLK
ncbi:transposase, partial [Alkalibacterium iburiense]|uniref:transposase n=1 Tax=Alkalibacterium iburiense TaxID=290589 RepID=UPI0031D2DAE7